jgi:hypothetical protein
MRVEGGAVEDVIANLNGFDQMIAPAGLHIDSMEGNRIRRLISQEFDARHDADGKTPRASPRTPILRLQHLAVAGEGELTAVT